MLESSVFGFLLSIGFASIINDCRLAIFVDLRLRLEKLNRVKCITYKDTCPADHDQNNKT